jgi:hypothetical protein
VDSVRAKMIIAALRGRAGGKLLNKSEGRAWENHFLGISFGLKNQEISKIQLLAF